MANNSNLPIKLGEVYRSLFWQQMQAYADDDYDYECYSPPGTSLSASGWIIKRVHKVTDDEGFKKDAKGQTLAYSLPATDVDVVSAGAFTNITPAEHYMPLRSSTDDEGETPVVDTFIRGSVRTIEGFYSTDDSDAELKLILLAANVPPLQGARYDVTDSVTEATESFATYADGVTIPIEVMQGLITNPFATNLLLNSATVVNQNITVVNATEYTLSVRGGTMTALGETATPSNPVTVTSTSTTLAITTASGTEGQVELGINATSYIPTLGVAKDREADLLSYPTDVINNTEGSVLITANLHTVSSSVDQCLIHKNISLMMGINAVDNLLKIYDGTTTTESNLSVALGINKIGLSWSGSVANVYLNGVKSADMPYDGAWLTAGLTIGSRFDGSLNTLGYLSDNQYYLTKLSDEDMIALVS